MNALLSYDDILPSVHLYPEVFLSNQDIAILALSSLLVAVWPFYQIVLAGNIRFSAWLAAFLICLLLTISISLQVAKGSWFKEPFQTGIERYPVSYHLVLKVYMGTKLLLLLSVGKHSIYLPLNLAVYSQLNYQESGGAGLVFITLIVAS